MGFFMQEPPLRAGETVLWRRPMSYSLETSFVGGTLYMTNVDLMFVPGKLARRYKGPLRLPLEAIAAFGVEERTGTPYNGGLRRRLRVEMSDGEVYLFVTDRPDHVVRELEQIVGSRGT
jgi:hypothetical protein